MSVCLSSAGQEAFVMPGMTCHLFWLHFYPKNECTRNPVTRHSDCSSWGTGLTGHQMDGQHPNWAVPTPPPPSPPPQTSAAVLLVGVLPWAVPQEPY